MQDLIRYLIFSREILRYRKVKHPIYNIHWMQPKINWLAVKTAEDSQQLMREIFSLTEADLLKYYYQEIVPPNQLPAFK